VRSAFVALIFACGLAAGFGAACQGKSDDTIGPTTLKTIRVVTEPPRTVTGELTSKTTIIYGVETDRGIKYLECNEYGVNCRRIKHFGPLRATDLSTVGSSISSGTSTE
jgi:hypothetical protein